VTRRTGVAALLFRLEPPLSSQELEELVGKMVGWLRQYPDYAELRRLFTELVRRAFIELGVTRPIPEGLLEMKTNLEKLGAVWKRQWAAEVWAEWKAEGKVEGWAQSLVDLLTERFGTVSPSLRKRIRGANLATLKCWFKRAIVAPDLASVFAQPR
jgi:hypothetical protein